MCLPSKRSRRIKVKRIKTKSNCCGRPMDRDWGNDNIGFNKPKKNIIKHNGRIYPEPQNKSNR